VTEYALTPIIWIDDDGEDRFPLELKRLRENRWDVSWALGVERAVEKLAAQAFRAVILDQMLPIGASPINRANVWQGCLLLHWLRGMPFPKLAPELQEWKKLAGLSPLEENRTAKMIVASAFFDAEVDRAIRAIEPNLISIAKPINAPNLIKALESLRVR